MSCIQNLLIRSGIFFHAPFRNCINCVHNCEDHSSFELFKEAILSVKCKCPEQWSNYRRVTNEVTSALRKAESLYFPSIFRSSPHGRAYWHLRSKLNGVGWRHPGIDINAANLMISYLALIYLDPFPSSRFGDGTSCSDKDEKETPRLR